MGLKMRNKLTAEFSMAAMTDFIFQLLIIFMLMSTLVSNQTVMDLNVPKSSSHDKSVTNSIRVSISKDLKYYVNKDEVPFSQLEAKLRQQVGDRKDVVKVEVAVDEEVPHKYFVGVADIVSERLKYRLVLVTTPAD